MARILSFFTIRIGHYRKVTGGNKKKFEGIGPPPIAEGRGKFGLKRDWVARDERVKLQLRQDKKYFNWSLKKVGVAEGSVTVVITVIRESSSADLASLSSRESAAISLDCVGQRGRRRRKRLRF